MTKLVLVNRVRLAWKKSLVAKMFTICFVATHVPLIALCIYLALGKPVDPVPIVVLVLVATLVSTVLSLALLHRMVRPVQDIVGTIETYRDSGEFKPLAIKRSDELGELASGISQLIEKLEGTLSSLRRQAYSDALTGLGNRRWLMETGGVEFARARREHNQIAMIVFDLDRFKSINDTYGHTMGDKVLVSVAAAVQQSLRAYDMLARIGGEEFCILIQDISMGVAIETAERMRRVIEALEIAPMQAGEVTASFGVHVGLPAEQTLVAMFAAADAQLYIAKGNGRNRVASIQDTNRMSSSSA